MKARKVIACSAVVLAILSGCGIGGTISLKNDSEVKAQLKIASDIFEPYVYMDDNGEYTGIDVEIAKEACRRLGYEPVFSTIDWSNKNSVLESGEADCLWGCYSIAGRENDYLWAGPYLYSRQVVVVRKDSGINNIADLAGKKTAVQFGSKAEGVFLNNAGITVPYSEEVMSFPRMDQAMSAFTEGYADAAAGHEGYFLKYLGEDSYYKELDGSILTTELGVAFSKNGNQVLADALSKVLNDMKDDGTTARIVTEYGLDEEKYVRGGVMADEN